MEADVRAGINQLYISQKNISLEPCHECQQGQNTESGGNNSPTEIKQHIRPCLRNSTPNGPLPRSRSRSPIRIFRIGKESTGRDKHKKARFADDRPGTSDTVIGISPRSRPSTPYPNPRHFFTPIDKPDDAIPSTSTSHQPVEVIRPIPMYPRLGHQQTPSCPVVMLPFLCSEQGLIPLVPKRSSSGKGQPERFYGSPVATRSDGFPIRQQGSLQMPKSSPALAPRTIPKCEDERGHIAPPFSPPGSKPGAFVRISRTPKSNKTGYESVSPNERGK